MRAEKETKIAFFDENPVKMRSFDSVFARIWRTFILDSCRLDLKDSREGLKYAVCAKTVSRGCLFWCILDVLDYFRLI